MTYHLAPALAELRNEVNARWPNRSKASDGWIGDPAHASRVSDHNPNQRGSVNALDITAEDIVPAELVAAAIAHPSTAYVIHDRSIWSRTYGWAKRPYKGSNPHTTHVHVSIQQNQAAEQNLTKWFRRRRFPLAAGHSFGMPPSARVHDGTASTFDADQVKRIQVRLRIRPTGRFGPYTLVKVANWQAWKKIRPTGRVGPVTWARLGL